MHAFDSLPIEAVKRMIERKGKPWLLLHTLHVVAPTATYEEAAPHLELKARAAVGKRIRNLEVRLGEEIPDRKGLLEPVSRDNGGHVLTNSWVALAQLIRPEFAR